MADAAHQAELTERADLIAALTQVQNHQSNRNRDILSITGCGMTNAEVRAHLESCISRIADWNFEQAQQHPKRRRRAVSSN